MKEWSWWARFHPESTIAQGSRCSRRDSHATIPIGNQVSGCGSREMREYKALPRLVGRESPQSRADSQLFLLAITAYSPPERGPPALVTRLERAERIARPVVLLPALSLLRLDCLRGRLSIPLLDSKTALLCGSKAIVGNAGPGSAISPDPIQAWPSACPRIFFTPSSLATPTCLSLLLLALYRKLRS